MQTQSLLLRLRIKWFQLNAKKFIVRYQNGLLVLVLFLPGVAIGDNLQLFFKALTTPFLEISSSHSSLLNKLIWLIVLQAVFVVFSRAQKTAITGGSFAHYMQSLPIDGIVEKKINLFLLLLANHFLWIVVLASFYFHILNNSDNVYLNLLNNLMLVIILLTTQYISVFKNSIQNVLLLFLLSLVFIFNQTFGLGYFGLFITILGLSLLVIKIFKPDEFLSKANKKLIFRAGAMKYNLYYQMLFRATTTATLFRLFFILFLITGFSFASTNFATNNEGNLIPYVIGLEALLAYYFSGFYVCFNDQRQTMKQLLTSLPVSKTFWFWRDLLTVTLISLLFHLLFYLLILHFINLSQINYFMIYHVFLLIVCYPLRTIIKQNQTHFTFAVLAIITAITLYHY